MSTERHRTIIIAVELGRGLGHVTRLAALARAFEGGERRIIIYTNDPEAMLSGVQAATAEVRLSPPIAVSVRPHPAWDYAGVIRHVGFQTPSQATDIIRRWVKIFETDEPDVVVCEHAPFALAACAIPKVKSVHVGTGFIVPPIDHHASLRPWAGEKSLNDWRHVDAVVRSASRSLGGNILDLCEMLASAERWLLTWQHLDHYGRNKQEDFLGPIGGVGARGDEERFRSAADVYVYHPVQGQKAQLLQDALVLADLETCWISSSTNLPESVGKIRFEQADVGLKMRLSENSVVVSRGGHGTAVDTLRSGSMSVLIPDTVESASLSVRLQQQGLGEVLPSGSVSIIAAGFEMLCREKPSRELRLQGAKFCSGYDEAGLSQTLKSRLKIILA